MKRAEKRRLKKETVEINILVNNFLVKYMTSIKRCRDDSRRALELQKEKIVKQNHEFQISNINSIYMNVWRGIVKHCNSEYIMKIDKNIFDKHMVWN